MDKHKSPSHESKKPMKDGDGKTGAVSKLIADEKASKVGQKHPSADYNKSGKK